jgi:hypothetical protein
VRKLDMPVGIVLAASVLICMCFIGTNTNLIYSFIIELCVLKSVCAVCQSLAV